MSDPIVRVGLRTALLVLALASAILGVLVTQQGSRNTEVVAASGDVIRLSDPIYGRATTLLVPDREITIGIGLPTKRIDWADVTGGYDLSENEEDSHADPPEFLVAPEDGRLVPISWQLIRRTEDQIIRNGPPVALHLLSGDQRIPLWTPKRNGYLSTVFTRDGVAVALPGPVNLDDLVIEVDYGGVVQRIDAATGELDTGAAQGLYGGRTFDTSCTVVPATCKFSAVSAGQPLLPSDAAIFADPVRTYAYDNDLGWAPEGSMWASTFVHTNGGYAYTSDASDESDGATLSIAFEQATQVRLIGDQDTVIEPTLNELAEATNQFGRVVFAVPTDVEPKALVLRQRATLEDDPRRVPLVARVPLT